MKLTQDQIYKALNLLNIPTNNSKNGDWLGILCPDYLHFNALGKHDTHFGNCSINFESGYISCFSCHQSISITDLIINQFNCDFKFAMKMIDGQDSIIISKPGKKEKKKIRKINSIEHNFTEIEFDPEHYYYTRQRGFTKEFNKEFGITRCLSGLYNDYMIIPCQDFEKKINEFECRRLFEYEKLNIFFDRIDGDYKKLKHNFDKYIKKNNIKLRDFVLLKNEEIFYDETIKYLLQSKVKYVLNSQLYRTLWNIDNLDYNKDLYLCEGMGSIPKLWHFISKNCSHTYGSKINQEQIETLRKFKKIIHIPDNDAAGREMIKYLHKELDNYVVLNIKSQDTDKHYVDEIKNAKECKPENAVTKIFFPEWRN